MARMLGKFTLFKCLVEKVWRMNRSAKGLLIVTKLLTKMSLDKCDITGFHSTSGFSYSNL